MNNNGIITDLCKMAQCLQLSAVDIDDCTDKLVIKPKSFRSRRYRRKKLRARRRRKLYHKRKHISRYSLFKQFKMSNRKDLMESRSTKKFVVNDTEWQHEREAYWKARAISLEYENRMLYKYIKQMYVEIIPQNEINNYNEGDEVYQDEENLYFEEMEEDATSNDDYYSKIKDKRKKSAEAESDSESRPPTEQISKKRNEEMETLYGSSWRKMLGMETALQLQYDHAANDRKTNFWPVIPLKM